MNAYRYAGNGPTNATDPTGMFSISEQPECGRDLEGYDRTPVARLRTREFCCVEPQDYCTPRRRPRTAPYRSCMTPGSPFLARVTLLTLGRDTRGDMFTFRSDTSALLAGEACPEEADPWKAACPCCHCRPAAPA